ncbi:MAG: hypothetical protein J6U69_02430 [Alistipes sp.]|nr:hypothetical protein [Alistipes sp.]
MDKILIYPPQGDEPIIEAPLNSGAKIVCKLMGEYYIELQFSHTSTLPLVRGSYINYNGWIYYLRRDAAPESLSDIDGYRYTLKFYGLQHLMEDCVFRWRTGGNNEITFNLTTNLDTFASLLAENMTAYMGNAYDILWTYTAVSEDISAQTKGLSFNGASCWQAMDDIAKAFGVEWSVREVASGSKRALAICFGKVDTGEYIDVREGEIVTRFPQARRGDDENYGTRFYVYGSTKNIPDDYYESVVGGTTNHISEKRLHLPNGQEYIDAIPNLSPTQIIEKKIILDDVFPENTETITAVEEVKREIIEGQKNTAYVLVCANTDFDPETMKVGTLGATFTSGALKDRSFNISLMNWVKGKPFSRKFEIVAEVEGTNGSSQIIIPNEHIKPNVGDTFVLTGVTLPREKVVQAENRLLRRGKELVKQYYSDTNIYDCPTNHVYCCKNNISLALGQRVRLMGAHFGAEGRKSRVQGFEKSLYAEFKATYNIGDNTIYNKTVSAIHTALTVVKEDIGFATNKIGQTDGKVQIISRDSNDNKENIDKISNDRQLYINEELTLKTDVEALDKSYGDFVSRYEELRDVNGELLIDANGQALRVRVPSEKYTHFKVVAKAYENELKAVIQSQGIVEPSEAFVAARTNYYKVRAELQKSISTGTKESVEAVGQGVDDLKYLSQVFGEDNNQYSSGAVLSRLLGVKSGDADNPDTVAGLYGGGVEALDDIGFKNADGQTLMMFAGAEGIDNAKNAAFRVYGDGSVFQGKGVFGGVIMRQPTVLRPDNIERYISGYKEFGDGTLAAQIDLAKVGSYIILSGFDNTPSTGEYKELGFPYYSSDDNTEPLYGLEYCMSLIGTSILVYVDSDWDTTGMCLSAPIINNNWLSFGCLQAAKGTIIMLTCQAGTDIGGFFNIGWQVEFLKSTF